ncbi:hypothetical protein [Staphylococcus aureus]|uniref:hypothetical protein n=1 Tax=Staphylococcus aureus TaxID=1280 RepID=UPI00085C791B|nr:hypothetical protein [Staphylococcus aureus]SCS21010.1 Uncharacterised protein [Staphylococcus aureus]HEG9037501.1 hypothetical protein [Staphylococcus aureus]
MRKRTKIIYRGWNKEIFILQGKNMNIAGLRQIFDELKKSYEGYKIVIIPIEVDFEIK